MEKFEAGPHSQLAPIAVFIDGFAFDEFHDKVRIAFVRRAAIEQASDILMLESRENLALFPEAGVNKLCIQTLPHQLDSDLFFGLCVRIRNFEDLTGFLQQGGLG